MQHQVYCGHAEVLLRPAEPGMATAARPAAADSASSLREAVRHEGVHANSDSAAPARGAAAAPPRQAANNASRSAERNGGGLKFGFLDMAGLQHCLRLRKNFAVTDTLSGEVGLDYNLNTRAAMPQYSLAYQARKHSFVLCRAWPQIFLRAFRPTQKLVGCAFESFVQLALTQCVCFSPVATEGEELCDTARDATDADAAEKLQLFAGKDQLHTAHHGWRHV